jgi:hypothetical protein
MFYFYRMNKRSKNNSMTMRFLFFTFLIALLKSQVLSSQTLTILFGGDVMGHGGQIQAAFNPSAGIYNYDSCFSFVAPVVRSSDYSLFNLEVTLAGPPFAGYPAFSSPDELAEGLKYMGANCLVTANNHSNDRHGKGLVRTLDVLESHGFDYTGTYRNKMERDTSVVLLIEINNIRVALLNYTYGTNGIPDTPPTIVNLLDTTMMFLDLQQAKGLEPDKIIVVTHWGNEYELLPSSTQKKQYEWLKKNGADIVIGSHPHVLQPMIWEKTDSFEHLVVFSLGNFVSNQSKPYTDGGAMFQLTLEKNEAGMTRIREAGYYLTWVYRPFEGGIRRYYVLPASQYEHSPDFFQNEEYYRTMKTFLEDSRTHLNTNNLGVFEYVFESSENQWILKKSVMD